jgi:hypothetical protein
MTGRENVFKAKAVSNRMMIAKWHCEHFGRRDIEKGQTSMLGNSWEIINLCRFVLNN